MERLHAYTDVMYMSYTTFNVTTDGGANESQRCISTCILFILLLLHSSCILRSRFCIYLNLPIHTLHTDTFVWRKKSWTMGMMAVVSDVAMFHRLHDSNKPHWYATIDVIGKCWHGCQIVMKCKRNGKREEINKTWVTPIHVTTTTAAAAALGYMINLFHSLDSCDFLQVLCMIIMTIIRYGLTSATHTLVIQSNSKKRAPARISSVTHRTRIECILAIFFWSPGCVCVQYWNGPKWATTATMLLNWLDLCRWMCDANESNLTRYNTIFGAVSKQKRV